MENFFKKSIKKLATGAAFVGALAGSPEKAYGQVIGVDKNKTKEKTEVPAYHTTDPHDPRIQAYKDSMNKYSTYERFAKNWRNDTIGFFGSKTKITTTKKPLEKGAGDFYKKDKIQPSEWLNKESYNKNYLGPTYTYNPDNGLYTDPSTPFIEEDIDRSKIKKIFPKITDENINEEIKRSRQDLEKPVTSYDQPFLIKGSVVGGPSNFTNDPSKGYKAESITNTKITKGSSSLPMYKKPVQEVVLDKTDNKIENIKREIEQKISEKEMVLPKGPLKYATVDKAGQKYFFMTDSVGGTVRSVTERAYQNDYKDLPEVKYEDLKKFQEGK
jgi:hypothetical protein